QAEDGIRDRNVTGVQTCALPISHTSNSCGRADATPISSGSRTVNPRSLLEADKFSEFEMFVAQCGKCPGEWEDERGIGDLHPRTCPQRAAFARHSHRRGLGRLSGAVVAFR